jgi:transposase InsO family protein
MALRVVAMDELKLQVLTEPGRTGESVAEVCRRRGISRQTFYVYQRRYLAEGPAGLVERSRRPLASPARIEASLEAEICTLRRQHPRWGARRIRSELLRAGLQAPAISTIHQALKRNFLVVPQRPRRQRANKRFEREAANDLWQIDATEVPLACGSKAWVVDCLDDHARFLLAALACASPTGEAAWACFVRASAEYGLPRQLLSDNHVSFTGRLFGFEVAFERRLRELGVKLINAAPAHPQTLGKLERLHRTLKEWLQDEPPAGDIDELQQLLDRFRADYNNERPHQAIGDRTPAERYTTALAPDPDRLEAGEDEPPVYAARALIRAVAGNGVLAFRNKHINIGTRYAGARVQIVEAGELVHVYYGQELIRTLAPDPDRGYQRLGKHRLEERKINP